MSMMFTIILNLLLGVSRQRFILQGKGDLQQKNMVGIRNLIHTALSTQILLKRNASASKSYVRL